MGYEVQGRHAVTARCLVYYVCFEFFHLAPHHIKMCIVHYEEQGHVTFRYEIDVSTELFHEAPQPQRIETPSAGGIDTVQQASPRVFASAVPPATTIIEAEQYHPSGMHPPW